MGHRVWVLVIALCACSVGCAHTIRRGQVENVDQLYALAVEELEGGLYPEAIKDLEEVKTKYPYSRYAALAELRVADAHFRRAKYFEALDAYRNFLKFHPNHDQADYAMFRIADAYFEQLPGEWLLFPPSAEKDQANTRMAIEAFEDMLARYPKGPSSDLARQRLADCQKRLASHEMYVAHFYVKSGHYRAAATRAEHVLARYNGLGLEAEALWLQGDALYRLGDLESARKVLQRLADDYATTHEAGRARTLLHRLETRESSQNEPSVPPAT